MPSLNRLTGVACALAGLCLLLVVIPDQVEAIEDSGVQPATVPTAVAWVLMVAGTFHALFPTGDTPLDVPEALRAGLFLAIVGGGVYLMSEFGFLYVAPGLVLAIMLVMGERRWFVLWIAALPVGIWAILELWLNRPLP